MAQFATPVSYLHILGFVAIVTASMWDSTVRDNDMGDYHREVFLDSRKAKAVLRRTKRGWWLGEEKEEREEDEESREQNVANQLAKTCSATCWGGWSAWSSCNHRCGSSGIKTATRKRAPTSACQAWVNSNGCPGQSSKTSPCNRECSNGGTPVPGRCTCKAGFKGTCCELKITCSSPGKPANGNLSPSASVYNYNTLVSFTCNTGYKMSGASNTRCLSNSKWSSSKPTCQIINCGDPGGISNGVKTGNSYTYGRTVVYRCNTGYRIRGSTSQKCGANGKWSGTKPSCIVVSCPILGAPAHGSVSIPSKPIYTSVATFSCNTGYYMQGSSKRICQANGAWNGATAKCLRTTCAPLSSISGGKVTYSSGTRYYGDKAVYRCDVGYRLQGGSTRTCGGTGAQGSWSGTAPRCTAVNCGDPGIPTNGAKSGNTYTYSASVSYQCQPGHYLKGAARIRCQSTGQWSAFKPVCTACARNTFKTGTNAVISCTPCPAHSHTTGTGSGNVRMCLCDSGYKGNPGGPCIEVRCPILQTPANSKITACHTAVGGACVFDCNNGYIKVSGDITRKCKPDGQWSGVVPVCKACPQNTYKSTATRCRNCPPNSVTPGDASMKIDCVCLKGYTGPNGGPCNDLDECEQRNGGCKQKCTNTEGSYKCECNIPGFIVHPTLPNDCHEDRICSKFPQPENGGAVCSRIWETNTKRCQVKCNYGYDFLEKPNPFELCGPDTNWRWSYEVADREIPACIEEFFEGVRTEADIFYFDDLCESLSAAQKQQVRTQFIKMLQDQGVCRQGNANTCNLDNVRIYCGNSTDFDFNFDFRRKRSTGSVVGKRMLDIKFDISVSEQSVKTIDCQKYCGANVDKNSKQCMKLCRAKYISEKMAVIRGASETLRSLFRNVVLENPVTVRPVTVTPQEKGKAPPSKKKVSAPTALVLKIGGRLLFPVAKSIKIKNQFLTECGSGTIEKNGMCVACAAGSIPDSKQKQCSKCPVGSHQPRPKMTSCLRCPPGSTTTTTGQSHCKNGTQYNSKPFKPVKDLDLKKVNKQMDYLIHIEALPNGGLLVLNHIPEHENDHVIEVDHNGQTKRMLYSCMGCSNSTYVTGLLLLGKHIFVLHVNGTVVQIRYEDGKIIKVHRLEVKGLIHTGSLSPEPEKIKDEDLLLLVDHIKGEVFQYKISTREKLVNVRGLENPSSVAYSSSNDSTAFVVCDMLAYHVRMYNSNWTLVKSIGPDSDKESKIMDPFAAVVSSSGTMFVSDQFSHLVKEFTSDGKFVRNVLTKDDGILLPRHMTFRFPYLWVRSHMNNILRFKVYE